MEKLIELTDWLTVDAAAEELGVDRSTVSRWIADGKLRAHCPRTGRRERVRPLLWGPDVRRRRDAREVVAGRA